MALEYVKYEVNIDFTDKLSKDFMNLLEEAEQADKNNNLAAYINLVDAIDNGAKTLCSKGCINSNQWATLLNRYTF